MRPMTLERVVLDKEAAADPAARQILDRLPGVPVSLGPDAPETRARPGAMDMDKRTLRLLPFQGEFLKPCPGTKGYICCGYQILQVGTNCPMDCAYCILQAYFNQPSLRVFTNLGEELERIGRYLDTHPERLFRIGTGEFTDSLALDPLVGWTPRLLPFFAGRRNAILELKTKTDHVAHLLEAPRRERVVLSWSLNSPEAAAREEHGAPSIRRRILAARRCQAEGYVLGFHFDPLIEYPGWKDGYGRTLDMLDRYIDPKGVLWISMGCFRYMPPLKEIIRRRHPQSRVLDGEFVPGLDGKMRYFKPIRMEMYGFMAENLRSWCKSAGIYLCMESHEVWHGALGWSPGVSAGLARYLDDRVLEVFG